jgi:hypothetical protein
MELIMKTVKHHSWLDSFFVDPITEMNTYLIIFFILMLLWLSVLILYYARGKTSARLRSIIYLSPLSIVIYTILSKHYMVNMYYSSLGGGGGVDPDMYFNQISYVNRMTMTSITGAAFTFIFALFVAITTKSASQESSISA